ncbi:MAG: diguanylate cyclase [Prochloraceae cyanobacterium]|nr:diguanylate cyclase [Prochloraceae cyanobacterium]
MESNSSFQELPQFTWGDLTNLANRRKFDEYLEEKWLEVLHNRSCMSLIICDIDRFREYNDIYGSLAGDDCLRKISEAIEKSSEQLSCLAARYGADKLAIVLPKKDAINAAALTEQIARQVKSLEIEHSGSDVSNYVTMSFGIASMLASGINKSEMLLIAADRALYQAKRTGRNRKVIWNNSYLKTTMKQS